MGGFVGPPSFPRPRVLVTREYDDEDEEDEDNDNEPQPDEDKDDPDTEELLDEEVSSEEEVYVAEPHSEAIAIPSMVPSSPSSATVICDEIKERAGKCVVCGSLPLESYICPNVHSVCGTCFPCLGDNSRKACPMCRVVNRFVPNYVYNHLVGRFWGREIKQQQLDTARATTSHAALLAEFRAILGPKNEVFCAVSNTPIARTFMLVFLQEYAATEGAKGLPAVTILKEKLKMAFPAPYSVLEYSANQEKLWWVYLGHLMTQDHILCIGCIKQHLYVISRQPQHNLL